ncbi:GNAT family N-acetyltransferase [Halorubellus sp. JP-L1]|uniref:GNAT family N-acetyltransferase n=1 Tax=Halorubellus sp. JP-L1 TaxID=2715753 RepID=UPI00140E8C88|nr:GNAT family N-acetyltransferase [Halorubellus sp. JP-L1]NHN41440.1 GNAT family N-acetyltransferase [Halorubellus sp. JP-L1]
MDVRPLRDGEVAALHDDCWLPFGLEMQELDAHDALAADLDAVRDANVAYRRDRHASDDTHTGVAVPGDDERRPPVRADALADPTIGDAAAVAAGTLDDSARFAGYAYAELGDSPPVFARGDPVTVLELYVRPEYRGDGLATDLLDTVESWGREHGRERVELHVHARNDAANGLYEVRGYETFMHKRRKSL